MSDVFASVGTVVAVSSALPATYDSTGYAALTFSSVGELQELPEFGAEQALATHTPLATGIVEKRGGSVDFGEVTLPIALTGTDAGEGVLQTKSEGAVTSDKRASFKVTLPTGDVLYFVGLVRSFTRSVGNADAIAMASSIVSITSAVVTVPAV